MMENINKLSGNSRTDKLQLSESSESYADSGSDSFFAISLS
jgi:hypothetical protein